LHLGKLDKEVIGKGEGFIDDCADSIVMLNEIIQFLLRSFVSGLNIDGFD